MYLLCLTMKSLLFLNSDVIATFFFFFFKHKTAYERRISDCSSDVCSSDLNAAGSRLDPPDFGRLRYDRHRSGRKTLAQRAKSGDLEVKRRATWGMSDGNGSDPDRMRVMRSCRWTGRLGGATRDR